MLALLCVGGGKGVKDGKDKKSKKKAGDEEEAEEETYYDAMKKEMGDRAARTKAHQLDHSLYCSPTINLPCIIHALLCTQYLNLTAPDKENLGLDLVIQSVSEGKVAGNTVLTSSLCKKLCKRP